MVNQGWALVERLKYKFQSLFSAIKVINL